MINHEQHSSCNLRSCLWMFCIFVWIDRRISLFHFERSMNNLNRRNQIIWNCIHVVHQVRRCLLVLLHLNLFLLLKRFYPVWKRMHDYWFIYGVLKKLFWRNFLCHFNFSSNWRKTSIFSNLLKNSKSWRKVTICAKVFCNST